MLYTLTIDGAAKREFRLNPDEADSLNSCMKDHCKLYPVEDLKPKQEQGKRCIQHTR